MRERECENECCSRHDSLPVQNRVLWRAQHITSRSHDKPPAADAARRDQIVPARTVPFTSWPHSRVGHLDLAVVVRIGCVGKALRVDLAAGSGTAGPAGRDRTALHRPDRMLGPSRRPTAGGSRASPIPPASENERRSPGRPGLRESTAPATAGCRDRRPDARQPPRRARPGDPASAGAAILHPARHPSSTGEAVFS